MGGANNGELLSRIAAGDGHGENSSYFDGWKAYDTNPFDLHHNPDGVIQMGLAENQVHTPYSYMLLSFLYTARAQHSGVLLPADRMLISDKLIMLAACSCRWT